MFLCLFEVYSPGPVWLRDLLDFLISQHMFNSHPSCALLHTAQRANMGIL